jgi:hypothetical protein
MYKRLTHLSFVIGLFFFIVSLVLIGNMFLNNATTTLNISTSIGFLVFGVVMMTVREKITNDK